ncbi:type II toxin-antitoxin system RelE/ParE family toxin [Candidatus Saganbacteria bacterium]|nr:type II toxin-antitoxin system RelE/ParE family toxin [Candidatus Saganbacteria bacterium]
MTREVLFTREAKKNLKKLPNHVLEKVKTAVLEIRENSLSGKPLRGILKGQYSFRIGDYRIVYLLSGRNQIYILYVRHRRDAYK